MKLYYSPGVCSLSPHIILSEAGIPFTLERVDLPTHKTASGVDFYSINPKGSVPALVLENGELLTEGVAIVQYIAAQAPEAKLTPARDSLEWFRMLEWLNFVATELHKSFTPLFRDWGDVAREAARQRLTDAYARVAKHLTGKDYLLGAQFSLPDAYLFTTLRWAEKMGIPLDAVLVDYMARMLARPAVQRVLETEGLVKAAA